MNEKLTERRIFTVSEITQDIKIILENSFAEVWVEGEVSNFSAQPSGHFYFSLKDGFSVLDAAMFSRANRDLKFKIENGLKVICFGKISNYGPRSKYNLIVEKIEPKGIGSLQLALEQLKQKLEKEGLFAPEHKRPIPYLPAKIAIVTSLQGAAIKDILKVVDRRFSEVEIIINSVQVQGEGAKDEIACAIRDLNSFNDTLAAREHIDVMIVGRGGGSIEDLWAFNEEVVARAIYQSKIPIISAVGHERDWTIADLVADLRAPTPSVAAELVVPKKEDLQEKLEDLSLGIKRAVLEILKTSKVLLENTQKKISLLNPVTLIQQHKIRADDLGKQIYMRTLNFVRLRETEFRTVIEKLSSLSPLGILSRGYSITFKILDDSIIKDARTIKTGDRIRTKLHKGEIVSQVTEVK
ncbi:MAG: exodeoxyribonuclease VII large subunit [Candidatus Omnitrophica bacterium]|nr:exodeoxyribonuclease VII large subunit [Candidatus Omnitrophota bacterium]